MIVLTCILATLFFVKVMTFIHSGVDFCGACLATIMSFIEWMFSLKPWQALCIIAGLYVLSLLLKYIKWLKKKNKK